MISILLPISKTFYFSFDDCLKCVISADIIFLLFYFIFLLLGKRPDDFLLLPCQRPISDGFFFLTVFTLNAFCLVTAGEAHRRLLVLYIGKILSHIYQ